MKQICVKKSGPFDLEKPTDVCDVFERRAPGSCHQPLHQTQNRRQRRRTFHENASAIGQRDVHAARRNRGVGITRCTARMYRGCLLRRQRLNLNRKENALQGRGPRHGPAHRRCKSRILQSFENKVRVHRIPTRHLCNRNTRRQRLRANQALLVVRPKPLLLTLLARHHQPQDVHYRWWTLSPTPSTRHIGVFPAHFFYEVARFCDDRVDLRTGAEIFVVNRQNEHTGPRLLLCELSEVAVTCHPQHFGPFVFSGLRHCANAQVRRVFRAEIFADDNDGEAKLSYRENSRC